MPNSNTNYKPISPSRQYPARNRTQPNRLMHEASSGIKKQPKKQSKKQPNKQVKRKRKDSSRSSSTSSNSSNSIDNK